jgi:DNA invertase Pin-like site-specific DNA recombinase
VVHTLHERGVGFQSLVEAIDTATPTGQFFLHVTGAFAELERNRIRERTMAGLASARQRGYSWGCPKAIASATFAMALQLYEARTTSVERICTRLGIARRSFYHYLAAHQ